MPGIAKRVIETKYALGLLGFDRRLNAIENKQIWTYKSVRTINGVSPDDLGNVNLSDNDTVYVPYTGATTNVDLGLHNLTVDTNTLFVDSVNHRAGIGTTTPAVTLDVVGRITSINPNYVIGSGGANLSLITNDAATIDVGGSVVFGGIYTGTSRAGWAGISGRKENATDNNYSGYLAFDTRANGSGSTEKMRITSGGFVGIGTTPAVQFDVSSNVASTTSAVARFVCTRASTYGIISIGSTDAGGEFDFYNGSTLLASVYGASTKSLYFTANGTTEMMGIHASGGISLGSAYAVASDPGAGKTIIAGKLGVGIASASHTIQAYNVTAPQAMFNGWSLLGGAAYDSNGVILIGNNAGYQGIFDYNSDGNTVMTIKNSYNSVSSVMNFDMYNTHAMTILGNGKVGIGTLTPAGKLDVGAPTGVYRATLSTVANFYGPSALAGQMALYSTDAAAVDLGGTFSFGGENAVNGGSASPYIFAQVKGAKEGAANTYNGYLAFLTTGADSSVPEKMRIDSAGKVGIGTIPTYTLDVQAALGEIALKSTTGTNFSLLRINNTGGEIWFGRESSVSGGLLTGSTPYAAVLSAQGTYPIQFAVNNAAAMTILNGGNVGIGTMAPTARLMIAAGSATAGTAPLKINAGAVNTTTEAGAIENDGTHLYFSAANGGTRYQLDQQSVATGGGNVKGYAATLTDCANTTTPTNIIATAIAANDVADGDFIHLETFWLWKNNKGTNGTAQIDIYFGTNYYTIGTQTITDGATEKYGHFQLILSRVGTDLRINNGFSPITSVSGGAWSNTGGTITPDFTSIQNMQIRVTLGAADASFYFKPKNVRIYKIAST